jgi:hypothetical protein
MRGFLKGIGSTSSNSELEERMRKKSGEPNESKIIDFSGKQMMRQLIEENLKQDDSFLGVINSKNASYLSDDDIDDIGKELTEFYKLSNKTTLFSSPVLPPVKLREKMHTFKITDFSKIGTKKGGYIRLKKLLIGYIPLVSSSSEQTGELVMTLHDRRLVSSAIRSIKFNTTIPAVGFMNMDYCVPEDQLDCLELKIVSGFTTVKRQFDYASLKLKADIEISNFPTSHNLVRTEFHVSIPVSVLMGNTMEMNHAQAFIDSQNLMALRSGHLNIDTPSQAAKPVKPVEKLSYVEDKFSEIHTNPAEKMFDSIINPFKENLEEISNLKPIIQTNHNNFALSVKDPNRSLKIIKEDREQDERNEVLKHIAKVDDIKNESSNLQKEIKALQNQKRIMIGQSKQDDDVNKLVRRF